MKRLSTLETEMAVKKCYQNNKKLIDSYYENNAKKLHKVVDRILKKLHFVNVDKEEFYTFASEIFVLEVMVNYDQNKSFDAFLYSTLYKKFCTEITRNRRFKRCKKIKVKEKDIDGNTVTREVIIPDERLNAPISDEENSTLEDMISHRHTIESEVFGENELGYSEKMTQYLDRLSMLQKEVLRLISIGFTPNEILNELNINKRQYDDCYNAIHAYRNISVLM